MQMKCSLAPPDHGSTPTARGTTTAPFDMVMLNDRAYISEHGEDDPAIAGWTWPETD
jgi:phosphoketolase